ncbi:MAG: hypothetical protein HC819_20860 [Cyclobacteriaceae bacterium]|nr:hypothetical protein [Cyclobacteriaceae bacterium]
MEAQRAFTTSQVLGQADAYILVNTATEFRAMFFDAQKPPLDAGKNLMNLYNFRIKSATEMNELARALERFHSKPKIIKIKKVKGGCA